MKCTRDWLLPLVRCWKCKRHIPNREKSIKLCMDCYRKIEGED